MPAISLRQTTLAIAVLTGLGGGALLAHPAGAATPSTTGTATTAKTAPGNATSGNTTSGNAATRKAIEAHVDARLATLKKQIGITTDEESAWQGFVQVSRHNATNLSGLYQARAQGLATMTAVQNMESYSAIAAKEADDMNSLTASFQSLYAKLTPTQQKKLDTLFRARAEKAVAKHMKMMKKKPSNG